MIYVYNITFESNSQCSFVIELYYRVPKKRNVHLELLEANALLTVFINKTNFFIYIL